MPFPDFYFLSPTIPTATPWGGEVNLFSFETIPRYIRMCVESWIYKKKYNWHCQTAKHVRGFINEI